MLAHPNLYTVSTKAGALSQQYKVSENYYQFQYQSGYNDGPRSSSSFTYASGMAFDFLRMELYVLEEGYNVIRKITDKNVTTILPRNPENEHGYRDGPVSEALFRRIHSMVVTRDGALLVSDTGSNCIRKIHENTVSLFAGNCVSGCQDGPLSECKFNGPMGMVSDPISGVIYVADYNNNCIRKIAEGNVTVVRGANWSVQNTDGLTLSLSHPEHLALDPIRQILYVLDSTKLVWEVPLNDTVNGIEPPRTAYTRWPNQIKGILCDLQGNLWVCDETMSFCIPQSGGIRNTMADGTLQSTCLQNCRGICIDLADNTVFVACTSCIKEIRLISSSSTYEKRQLLALSTPEQLEEKISHITVTTHDIVSAMVSRYLHCGSAVFPVIIQILRCIFEHTPPMALPGLLRGQTSGLPTPISIACTLGSVELLEFLLQYDTEGTIYGSSASQALEFSLKEAASNPKIVSLLAEYINRNLFKVNSQTLNALARGQPACILRYPVLASRLDSSTLNGIAQQNPEAVLDHPELFAGSEADYSTPNKIYLSSFVSALNASKSKALAEKIIFSDVHIAVNGSLFGTLVTILGKPKFMELQQKKKEAGEPGITKTTDSQPRPQAQVPPPQQAQSVPQHTQPGEHQTAASSTTVPTPTPTAPALTPAAPPPTSMQVQPLPVQRQEVVEEEHVLVEVEIKGECLSVLVEPNQTIKDVIDTITQDLLSEGGSVETISFKRNSSVIKITPPQYRYKFKMFCKGCSGLVVTVHE
ncbi:hypothetical protein Pelo_11060 [Pelomyxa schiedti]|nr:hypothetical protein Pelo_11060 [Pelomyxa schiedti]